MPEVNPIQKKKSCRRLTVGGAVCLVHGGDTSKLVVRSVCFTHLKRLGLRLKSATSLFRAIVQMVSDTDLFMQQYDVIEEGPYSTVSRIWDDREAQWTAVKSASILRRFTREPHDILKELRLLSDISHPNVCALFIYKLAMLIEIGRFSKFWAATETTSS